MCISYGHIPLNSYPRIPRIAVPSTISYSTFDNNYTKSLCMSVYLYSALIIRTCCKLRCMYIGLGKNRHQVDHWRKRHEVGGG